MKIPSTTTWGLINDLFIYLACVMDFSIWEIITWAAVTRGSCNNKFNHVHRNECILHFQISDCILFILCGFTVSEENRGSGLERICQYIIFVNVILWYTSILNNNWAAYFARLFKNAIILMGLTLCLLMLYLHFSFETICTRFHDCCQKY